MEIKTKFDLDQIVYPIVRHGYNGVKKCKTCNGVGTVKINNTNKKITCPDCYGRGEHEEWIPARWTISEHVSKIGKIETEHYAKKYKKSDSIKYMLKSTGVGSGTLWDEKDLFATAEEAEQECNIRNS